MAILTADDILAADDIISGEVLFPVPEWSSNGKADEAMLRLVPMSGMQRDRLSKKIQDGQAKNDITNLFPQIIVACAVDDEAKPLFSQKQVAALNEKNAKVIERVATECMRISGLTAEGEEEIEGN